MKLAFLRKKAPSRSDLIKSLEEAIEKKRALKITAPPPPLKILPYRLVYLQGELSLVGEDMRTHQLLILGIGKIENIKAIKQKYQNNFSSFDIDQFIEANRKMSDQEYRLILRLSPSFMHIDLEPKFHFFGNPCLVSSAQGDFIWGASVELNEELLQWLADIKKYVHIIDPPEIKDALVEYLVKDSLD